MPRIKPEKLAENSIEAGTEPDVEVKYINEEKGKFILCYLLLS